MTTFHPEAPARRRRHARLIAALARLVRDTAGAAVGVYEPIAAAPPDQTGVTVHLLPIMQVAAAARYIVDAARAEDTGRWPAVAAREAEEHGRTFAARCAAAEAEDAIWQAQFTEDSDGALGGLALFTPSQAAHSALVEAGEAFLAALQDDPQEAVSQLQELVATGEFTAEQVLDAALDTAVLCGLLVLQELRPSSDAGMAAESCLAAGRYFSLAVSVASIDL
ncbi:hypothetical protein ACWDO7_22870 [Streptomyces sp. NPDC003656]